MHFSGITQYVPHSNTIQIKITSSILSLLGLLFWVDLPRVDRNSTLILALTLPISLRPLFSSSLTYIGCSVLVHSLQSSGERILSCHSWPHDHIELRLFAFPNSWARIARWVTNEAMFILIISLACYHASASTCTRRSKECSSVFTEQDIVAHFTKVRCMLA